MPSSSSRTAVVLKRPLTNARLAVHDGPGGNRPAPGGFDLKEIQRRAFDRGVAVEREKGSRAFAALCTQLKAELAARADALANDQQRAEEFAVRVALLAAEKLTKTVIAAGEHDVAALVQGLLTEMALTAKKGETTLRVAPDDHGLLIEASARGEIDLKDLEVQPDPRLSPGSAVIEAGQVEYWADLNDRVERLRESFLSEARDGGV